MDNDTRTQEEITRSGNPAKPVGEDGKTMLSRMNESHYAMTGWALSFWTIAPADRILDCGCGGGMTVHRMAEQVQSGKVTGIDYSKVSVAASKDLNFKEIQAGKAEILEASVDDLPFPDGTFDKVITLESFYFWPDAVRNLKEVRRVLEEGGTFLLVADIYGDLPLTDRERENIERYSLRNPTIAEFRELFSKAGFSRCLVHTKEGTTWICVEGTK